MSRQSVQDTVNVYGIPEPSGFYSVIQIFKPGGITNVAGTPNFLLDVEDDAYQVAFKELQQGGLDQATFYLRKFYEDNVDIVFGNWIIFGVQGGLLPGGAAAGAGTLAVSNLKNNTNESTGLELLNIQANDPILISDGVNTEIFIASAVSGSSDPYTITLGAAPGIGRTTLLNSFGAGARVVRLVYQGIIQSRERNTRKDNQFQIVASGMFIRYGQAVGNSSASQVDGATLVSDVLNSYTTTLPEIIVNPANLATSSIPVTVSEQDARISQILADIIKQEDAMVPSGSNGTLSVTPTALNFPTTSAGVQRAIVSGGNAPYRVSSSNGAIATAVLYGADAVNTTSLSANAARGATSFAVATTSKNINGTITTSATGSLAAGDLLLFDAGNKAEYLTIATVSGSTVTTTAAAVYAHASGCTVVQKLRVDVSPVALGDATITVTDAGNLTVSLDASVVIAPKSSSGTVWSIWVDALRQVHHNVIQTQGTPTKTLDLNTGSVYGDILGPLDTVDMDGTSLMNAAVVRGGQDAAGNRIRCLVVEQYSQTLLDAWYEGVLDNTDISDEKQLANWAASQLAILAYPVTSASLTLVTSSMRVSTQDLVAITGFTDGSTLLVNPVEIDYVVDAQTQLISATMNLGILRPDTDDIAREYANERSIRESYNVPNANLHDTYVVDGFAASESGKDLAITAGHVVYGNVKYAVPALASTAVPTGVSFWGAQVGGSSLDTLPAIEQMPSSASLSAQYGANVYTISSRGGAPVPASDFVGLPLFKVTASDTQILSITSIAQLGGVDGNNLTTIANSAVTVSGVTLGSYTGQAGTTGIDVTLSVNFTGSYDDVSAYRIIAVPHGLATSSSWLWSESGAWGEGSLLKSAFPTNPTDPITIAVANMPLGVQLDLYFFVLGTGGASAVWPSSNPIATTIAQSLSTNVMPKMPAGASFTASSVLLYPVDPGVHTLSTTPTSSLALLNPGINAQFTLNESTVPDTSQWASSGNLYLRPHSGLSTTDKTTYDPTNQGSLPGYFTNGKQVTFWARNVTAGVTYDVACSLLDSQSNETPLVYLGQVTVPQTQSSTTIGPIFGRRVMLPVATDPVDGVWDATGNGFDHGAMSTPVRGVVNAGPDAFGSHIVPGIVHRLIMEQSGEPGGTNLIYNPTFANGLMGWSPSGVGGFTWSTDNFGGGRLICVGSSASRTEEYYEQISVTANSSMVGSGRVYLNATGSSGFYYRVNVYGIQSATVLGSFDFVLGGASEQPFAFALNTGTNTQVKFGVVVYNGSTGGVCSGAFSKLQLEYGTQPSAWVDHAAAVGHNKVFDGSQNMLHSTPFTANIPNSIANLLSNITVQTYSSASGALAMWFTSTSNSSNPAGSQYPAWTFPDGSGGIYPGHTNGAAAICGTSQSATAQNGTFHWTGLGSGGVYIGVSYNNATDAFSIVYGPSSTAPTDAQVAAATGDGNPVVVVATATTSTSIPTGGGGGHTAPGGGGRAKL